MLSERGERGEREREGREVDGVVTVKGRVQHTDKQELGVEGKSQPKVLLVVGRCKISTCTVRN